jgi:hypothetical protein
LEGGSSGLFKHKILEVMSRQKRKCNNFKPRHPFAQQSLKLGTTNASTKHWLFEMGRSAKPLKFHVLNISLLYMQKT